MTVYLFLHPTKNTPSNWSPTLTPTTLITTPLAATSSAAFHLRQSDKERFLMSFFL